MGGGKSSSSATPPPPPKPIPDYDVAAMAAEEALKGQAVQAYDTSKREEEDKKQTGTLASSAVNRSYSNQSHQPRRKSGASMMGSQAMAESSIITG